MYLSTCNYCRKQYIGETNDTLGAGEIITKLATINLLKMIYVPENTCLDIFIVKNLRTFKKAFP